ncbi:hypothetical protein BC941DRAFT_445624 [Chlamydoabsidia padenii]|nr:hypothetical protein BC941DRAFT_445624 [Chlamydoabsidia padenii]
MPPTDSSPLTANESPSHKKSWFSGFLAHWHPISKWTSASTTTTQLSTATTKSKNNMLEPRPSSPSLSSTSTTTNSSNKNTTITIQIAPPIRLSSSDDQQRTFNERRQSQQTIGSLLSDDYLSFPSSRRNSEERSRLGDLWSKARKRHPHYPRFHWPHHKTPMPIPSQPQVVEKRLATSYQDPPPPRPLSSSSSPSSMMMLKRHSITSLISSDSHYSRPNSVMAPVSPKLLFMKDGQLWDDEDELDDDYCLDDTYRWTLKHDLLKLALNGCIGCPLEDGSDKQVLQIGCGDGSWCVDVAISNPKWTVIGIEESGYDLATNNNNKNETLHHHHHLLFKPKNMKLIRCAPSMLHALQKMPDHMFDLVDGRCLILAYGLDMYQQLIKECWRVCKIGGFVELIEMDMRMYHSKPASSMTTIVQSMNSKVIHRMESRSLDPRLARRLPDLLDEVISIDSIPTIAGYTSLPIGVWGGRLGVMFREDVHRLMETVQPDQDLDNELDQMDNEMELQRSFMNLHHCYAQKTC